MIQISTDVLITIAILAAAASTISMTISKAGIFASLRTRLYESNHLPLRWLGQLSKCYYCLSHWITFALVGRYRTTIFQSNLPLIDIVATTFFIIFTASILSWILYGTYRMMDLGNFTSAETLLLRAENTLLKKRLGESVPGKPEPA